MEAFPTGLFRGPFFGKVISSGLVNAADPDLRKWDYNVELVEFDGQEWNDHAVSPELTGVRNVFESANTSNSSMGILHDNLPGTYELKSIPNDTVVPIWITPVGAFTMWPNQFDGKCGGACCVGETCTEVDSEEECIALGGTYAEGIPCDEVVCGELP
jgi:hypothetical protein